MSWIMNIFLLTFIFSLDINCIFILIILIIK